MKIKYKQWIENNVVDPKGKCKEYSNLMNSEFPELKKVRGWYYLDRDIPHWWLVDENDNIIDPTIDQFVSKNGVYIPIDESNFIEPSGKCLNCGRFVYGNELDKFCSVKCGEDFVKDLLFERN